MMDACPAKHDRHGLAAAEMLPAIPAKTHSKVAG